MKRIFPILAVLVTFLFSGCRESNSAYINRIKQMTDGHDENLEQIIDNYIVSAEFLHANRDITLTENLMPLLYELEVTRFEAKNGNTDAITQMSKILSDLGVKYPEIEKLKWKVIQRSDNKGVIGVYSDNIYLKFPVYHEGNKTIIKFSDIEVFSNNNELINRDHLDAAYEIIHFIGNESHWD